MMKGEVARADESDLGGSLAALRPAEAGGEISGGRVTIAPQVLVTIARLTTQGVEGVAQMCHQIGPSNVDRLLGRAAGGGGVQIAIVDDTVRVDLYIIVEQDVNMRSVSQKIQRAVTRAIQEMVGMQVRAVNIHIQDVAFDRRSS